MEHTGLFVTPFMCYFARTCHSSAVSWIQTVSEIHATKTEIQIIEIGSFTFFGQPKRQKILHENPVKKREDNLPAHTVNASVTKTRRDKWIMRILLVRPLMVGASQDKKSFIFEI